MESVADSLPLQVSAPFVVNGTEFISVSFLGQSFMLHQIVRHLLPSSLLPLTKSPPQRKMIGLAILAIRTSTPPSLVAETFGPSRIHVPKAPGLGLLLLEPQYLEYNKRVDESNKKLVVLEKEGRIKEQEVGEQTRDPVEIGALLDKVDAFKKEEIYKKMWEVEEKDAVYVFRSAARASEVLMRLRTQVLAVAQLPRCLRRS